LDGDQVDASPAMRDGVVYAGSVRGEFAALDVETGERVWSVDLPGGVYASAAIGEDRVYTIGFEGAVVALDMADGTVIWQQDIGGPTYASPTLSIDSDGTAVLYAITEQEGLLVAFDGADGTGLWRTQTGREGDFRSASPVLVERVLYVASNSRGLLAFGGGIK
jgi:outer membrane protein assembly factor BamB